MPDRNVETILSTMGPDKDPPHTEGGSRTFVLDGAGGIR